MATHSSTLAWKIPWTAHGVAKSRTRLSNFTFTFHFHALEKEMATHSSVLAQRHPGKFPKVPGRRRGKRLFPATTRERPRAQSRTQLKRLSSSSSNMYCWFDCFGDSSDNTFPQVVTANSASVPLPEPSLCFLTVLENVLLKAASTHRAQMNYN